MNVSNGRAATAEERGHRVAMLTAIGTLLAGAAAILTVFVRGDGGGADVPRDPPTAAAATETGTAAGSSAKSAAVEQPDIAGFVALRSTVQSFGEEHLGQQGAALTGEFQEIASTSDLLIVDFPTDWQDVETTNWLADRVDVDEVIGETVIAAHEVDDLYDTDDAPGAFIAYSQSVLPLTEVMDIRVEQRSRICRSGGVGDFNGDGFTGMYGLWSGCGAGSITLDLVVTAPRGGTINLFLRLSSKSELPAAERILSSLRVQYPSDSGAPTRAAPGNITP
jgi:hypothetical protein